MPPQSRWLGRARARPPHCSRRGCGRVEPLPHQHRAAGVGDAAMSAMPRIAGAVAVAAASGTGAALAQTPVTVRSLLDQEFLVVGTVASQAGPGVFLQKKDKLFFC